MSLIPLSLNFTPRLPFFAADLGDTESIKGFFMGEHVQAVTRHQNRLSKALRRSFIAIPILFVCSIGIPAHAVAQAPLVSPGTLSLILELQLCLEITPDIDTCIERIRRRHQSREQCCRIEISAEEIDDSLRGTSFTPPPTLLDRLRECADFSGYSDSSASGLTPGRLVSGYPEDSSFGGSVTFGGSSIGPGFSGWTCRLAPGDPVSAYIFNCCIRF